MVENVLGIIEKDGNILLVKRKKDDGILWSFPGGKVEVGESSEEAIAREVKEECDVVCNPIRLLGSRIHPVTNVEIEYWLCEFQSGEAKVAAPEEIEEVAWKTKDEVLEMFGDKMFEKVRDYFTNNK